MADQEIGGPLHHGIRVEVQESLAAQAVGQQHRVADLVELQALPVGPAVRPEILIEASILALTGEQVLRDLSGCPRVAGGEQTERVVVEIARPDQVVAAGRFIGACRFAPGNGQ